MSAPLECGEHVLFGQPFRRFARARIAEAAGAQRDAAVARQSPRCGGSRAGGHRDRRSSSSRCRRASPSSPDRRCGPSAGRSRGAVRRSRSSSQPVRQRDAGVDGVDARSARGAADRSRRPGCSGSCNVPSSKPASRGARICARALHGREVDRAAGKPRPPHHRQGIVAGEQAANAGRIPEHLVERDGDEIGPNATAGRAGSSARTRRHRAARRQPSARASSISSSGCFTPEKFDCAGKANRLACAGIRGGETASRGDRGRCAARET